MSESSSSRSNASASPSFDELAQAAHQAQQAEVNQRVHHKRQAKSAASAAVATMAADTYSDSDDADGSLESVSDEEEEEEEDDGSDYEDQQSNNNSINKHSHATGTNKKSSHTSSKSMKGPSSQSNPRAPVSIHSSFKRSGVTTQTAKDSTTQNPSSPTQTNATAQQASNRTARACSWCRRRKRKCDGARPTCCWCAKGQLSCNYPSTLLKRGPQSGMMKKLKKKVEELEQQLNSVRDQPNGGVALESSAVSSVPTLSTFVNRIRSSRLYHQASTTAAMGSPLTPQQMQLLRTQSPSTHIALRDRLYLTSFLCSFNEVFPLIDKEWEATYLQVLSDDLTQPEPPIYWTFQYASAVALGALMHDDETYATEACNVAKHAASSLFDEAHSEVLRGLLMLCFVLIGLGQLSRATCYVAVANRMVYLLSRPMCINPHVASSGNAPVSTLSFPGTFPEARVPLSLPPSKTAPSGQVTMILKLLHSMAEDFTCATTTMEGSVKVGFDRIERYIVEQRKRVAANKSNPPAPSSPSASNQSSTEQKSQESPTVSITSMPVTPYHPLNNDHLLTLGLECRHYATGIFDESIDQSTHWKTKLEETVSTAIKQTQPCDLTIAHASTLRLFTFLSSFRGDFMQCISPTSTSNSSLPNKSFPISTAASSSMFDTTMANVKNAHRLADLTCECLTLIANSAAAPVLPDKGDSTDNFMYGKKVKSEGSTSGGSGASGVRSITSVDQSPSRLRYLLTQTPPSTEGQTPQQPLFQQPARVQLHGLALLFKAVFAHIIELGEESNSTPSSPDPSSKRKNWSNVILCTNTATNFIEFHQLDLSYCPLYALLLHLNVQIKLKYLKQCIVNFTRIYQTQKSPKSSEQASSAAVSIVAASQSVLDCSHYLHQDFEKLDQLNLHWSHSTAFIWKDAQERVNEILNFLIAGSSKRSGNSIDGDDEAVKLHHAVMHRSPLFTVGTSLATKKTVADMRTAVNANVVNAAAANVAAAAANIKHHQPTQSLPSPLTSHGDIIPPSLAGHSPSQHPFVPRMNYSPPAVSSMVAYGNPPTSAASYSMPMIPSQGYQSLQQQQQQQANYPMYSQAYPTQSPSHPAQQQPSATYYQQQPAQQNYSYSLNQSSAALIPPSPLNPIKIAFDRNSAPLASPMVPPRVAVGMKRKAVSEEDDQQQVHHPHMASQANYAANYMQQAMQGGPGQQPMQQQPYNYGSHSGYFSYAQSGYNAPMQMNTYVSQSSAIPATAIDYHAMGVPKKPKIQ